MKPSASMTLVILETSDTSYSVCSFCDWLISHSVMFSWLIHIVAWMRIFFLNIYIYSKYRPYCFFIHPLRDSWVDSMFWILSRSQLWMLDVQLFYLCFIFVFIFSLMPSDSAKTKNLYHSVNDKNSSANHSSANGGAHEVSQRCSLWNWNAVASCH